MSLNLKYHYKQHSSCMGEWEKGKIVEDLFKGEYTDIVGRVFTSKEEVIQFITKEDIWFDKHGNMASFTAASMGYEERD